MKLLERIYERLLNEAGAPSVDGYGADTFNVSRNSIDTVIYDVPTLKRTLLDAFSAGGGKETVDVSGSIVGYVSITKPTESCWDAYEVSLAAGPGKIVYGCAYATSPSGLVMSHRESMTPKAKSAWRGMAAKGTRGRKKLDNVYDPVTPEPEDDCFLRDEDDLDYAYEATEDDKKMLEKMVAEHEALRSELIRRGGALAEYVESDLRIALRAAGLDFFDKKSDPYGG